jgi:hypothetical protein
LFFGVVLKFERFEKRVRCNREPVHLFRKAVALFVFLEKNKTQSTKRCPFASEKTELFQKFFSTQNVPKIKPIKIAKFKESKTGPKKTYSKTCKWPAHKPSKNPRV